MLASMSKIYGLIEKNYLNLVKVKGREEK
jgi:hypothetical protein